jgi:DNA-binding transcriptional LysR family regulator
MGRIAGEFCKQFPDVHMEVTIEDRKVDLVEEGYDVVIRVNPDPDSDLVGRCFYRDHLLVVAPPSLARPIQSTDSHSNASIPAVVGITMPEFAQWAVSDGANVYRFQRHAVMKLSSPLMIRDAVLAGAGAAILGQKHVKKDIAEGRLVSWGVVPNQAIELWVLHTSRRLVSPKVSAFVTFLYETHRDYRE